MILIYAEKADVGSKIAAALDKITLEDGTIVTFEKLGSYGKKVNELQKKQGYLMIKYKGEYTGIREMRKHFAWYTAGLYGYLGLRSPVYSEKRKGLQPGICKLAQDTYAVLPTNGNKGQR